jgi:hypothetical protein
MVRGLEPRIREDQSIKAEGEAQIAEDGEPNQEDDQIESRCNGGNAARRRLILISKTIVPRR